MFQIATLIAATIIFCLWRSFPSWDHFGGWEALMRLWIGTFIGYCLAYCDRPGRMTAFGCFAAVSVVEVGLWIAGRL